MNFSKSLIVLLSVMIPMLLLPTFAGTVSAQSEYEFVIDDFSELQLIDRCFQEREALQNLDTEKTKTIAELQNRLEIEREKRELAEKELDLQKRIDKIKDDELAATNRALDRMNEVADRAIKLAEVKKPASLFETWGPIAVIAIIVVTIASVL